MTQQPSFRDLEKLSALLDGRLSKSERTLFESRLEIDANLREIRADMHQARMLMKQAPRRKVPRNFFLSPGMIGVRPPIPRSVPFLRLVSITAAFLFFVSFASNYLAPIAAAPNLAAAPALSSADSSTSATNVAGYGFGGGPVETATPEQVTSMALAPSAPGTPTPQPTPESGLRTMEQPTEVSKTAPGAIPPSETTLENQIRPQFWKLISPLQIGLVILVLACAALAFIIGQISSLRWRKKQ